LQCIKQNPGLLSKTTKESKLWLGPAAFVDLDREPNTDILALGGYDTIIVKADRKINIGEVITTYYGEAYFGLSNEECILCLSCEIKHEGRFRQIIHSPISGIDIIFIYEYNAIAPRRPYFDIFEVSGNDLRSAGDKKRVTQVTFNLYQNKI